MSKTDRGREIEFTCPWCFSWIKSKKVLFALRKREDTEHDDVFAQHRKNVRDPRGAHAALFGGTIEKTPPSMVPRQIFIAYGKGNGFEPVFIPKGRAQYLAALKEKNGRLREKMYCPFCHCGLGKYYSFIETVNICFFGQSCVDIRSYRNALMRGFQNAMPSAKFGRCSIMDVFGDVVETVPERDPFVMCLPIALKNKNVKFYVSFFPRLMDIHVKEEVRYYRKYLMRDAVKSADAVIMLTRCDDSAPVLKGLLELQNDAGNDHQMMEPIEKDVYLREKLREFPPRYEKLQEQGMAYRSGGCRELQAYANELQTEKPTAVIFKGAAVLNRLVYSQTSLTDSGENRIRYISGNQTESHDEIYENLSLLDPMYLNVIRASFPDGRFFSAPDPDSDLWRTAKWIIEKLHYDDREER